MRCADCNQPIGTISNTLYKFEGKHFCADCFSKTIITKH
jgi:hypothetical protein